MNTAPQSGIEVLSDAVSHDLHFYKPDGNVVLQAEQTLFRVHRSFLADLSPVLKNMLELPLGDELLVEGLEDAHPIVLAGDTAEEVRSLLWAIYSRPDEIASFLEEAPMNALCIRFLQIMRLTHKYDCSKLLGWAFNALRSETQPDGFFKGFTASMTTIACVVQLHPLSIRGFTNWAEPLIRRTMTNKNTVYIAVIRLLSSVQWPWLEKYLYYRLLCLGTASWKALTLTNEERMRLLSGYHNLRELWAKLSTERLAIKHTCAAAARVQCLASCLDLWLELCTLSARGTPAAFVDLTGRMRLIVSMKEALRNGGGSSVNIPVPPSVQVLWATVPCQKEFKVALQSVSDEMEKNALCCLDPSLGLIDHTACTLPLSVA